MRKIIVTDPLAFLDCIPIRIPSLVCYRSETYHKKFPFKRFTFPRS